MDDVDDWTPVVVVASARARAPTASVESTAALDRHDDDAADVAASRLAAWRSISGQGGEDGKRESFFFVF